MIRLGLTGSIGMGKTTTAQMFRDRNIPVWDADAAVHRLYAQGGSAVDPVAAIFPDAVRDGAVDRARLRGVVTTDPDALARLEAIVHPLVAADRAAWSEARSAPMAVFDIPLLYETDAAGQFDHVAVVSTDPDTQRRRVMERGTMTGDQFDAILAKQMPDAEKRRRADYIIDTSTMDGARQDVDRIIAELT
ncbi:dephospho-CoA kinase [Jannaschia aquimarina]|uniref:Dephospho-CoA kinase n=1 Tax=Jannaschia aquimarina TaxID=935700 RepID=A0A0D1D4G7_9RHOB|nr:dephospho-CoA kinase [Jannaschia aquimarina]KIT14963.1 Dephospho-CoA kinase [Jannaschia aquimarina]SNS60581.1 dephospho-CoA kinase [Jannaschia aquimarina]